MNKWINFDFNTSDCMASNKGHVRGMVNIQTGNIIAKQFYGTMGYYDDYRLNISDKVNDFPYTTEDRIILSARKIISRENLQCIN